MSDFKAPDALAILEAVARPSELEKLIDAGVLSANSLRPVFDQGFDKNNLTPLLAQAVYRASIIGGFHDKDLVRGLLRPLVSEIIQGVGDELAYHQLINTIYIAPELLALKRYNCSALFASIGKPQMHWLWANPDSYSVVSEYLDQYIEMVLASKGRPPNFLALSVSYVAARMAREPRPVLDKAWRSKLEANVREFDGAGSVNLLGPSYAEGPRARLLMSPPKVRRKRMSIAICITGQLRGFDRAVESWVELLQPDADYEFFLSTWAYSGAKAFSWQHINRFVDREAGDSLVAFRDRVGLEKATRICGEFFGAKRVPVDVNRIADSLKRYGRLASYSLVDEGAPGVSNLANPEKMYFHNQGALNLLRGRLHEFDLVVKIRPDMLVGYRRMQRFWSHLAQECAAKSIVYAETGFRYEEWGFGCGDQIGIGAPHDMAEYMSVWEEREYHAFQAKAIRGEVEPTFGGHISLAVQMLRRGIDVNTAPLEFRGLSSDPLLTKGDIAPLLDQ